MIAAVLLCAVADVACVASGSVHRARHSAPSALSRELSAVEERGPDATLAFVERRLPLARTRRERGELEAARAGAQRELGQPRSAMAGYRQAWSLLGPQVDLGVAEMLADWGDLSLAVGQADEAAEHYEAALRAEGLPSYRREALVAALVVACEQSGDRGASARWRSQLGAQAATLVANAERRLRPGATTGSPAPVAASARVPSDPRSIQPGIHRRSEWRASPTRGNVRPMRPVTSITLHHSAMAAPGASSASVASHLRGIQSFHVEERGWADIGYHFLVDPSGRVWEGRPLAWQGAHAGGDNNIGNVGVCLLGDFGRQPVPSAQLAGAEALVDALRGHFGVPTSRVRTHRECDGATTDCPGEYLQRAVGTYRSRGRLTASLP